MNFSNLCLLYLYQLYALFFLGINIFLDGFVPTENLRFRETSLTFKVAETADKVRITRIIFQCTVFCEFTY
jgi:translation initiation factor RLI1